MSIYKHQWSEILDDVIAHQVARDPATMPEAAVGNWEKLAAIMIPLLGQFSFYLIYRRSLDLNKSIFPWLPMATRTDTMQDSFTELRQAFEQQGSGDVARVNLALLRTFTELLVALIGARLTAVYLLAAFPGNDRAESTEENPL